MATKILTQQIRYKIAKSNFLADEKGPHQVIHLYLYIYVYYDKLLILTIKNIDY